MAPGGLETTRLRLDPWDERHTELLLHLSSIADVMRYVGPGVPWPPSRAQEVADAQRAHWDRHGFGWRVAVEKATGRSIGFIALNVAGEGTVGLDPGEYEIGWWLAPVAWGRGLAREGAQAVRDDVFTMLSAPSVVARIHPANARSMAVARGTGLTFDFRTTGQSGGPVAVYRLRAEDWHGLVASDSRP